MATTYKMKVKKIGRKWMQVEVSGKYNAYSAQLFINDASKNLKAGQNIELECNFEDKSTSYGKKYNLYPVTVTEKKEVIAAETAKQVEKEAIFRARKIENYVGYVEEAAEKGYVYEKGVELLRELGAWTQELANRINAMKKEAQARKEEERAAARVAKAAEEAKYKIEQQNGTAAERAKEKGLPTLTGTKKQVAWANDIRKGFIEDLEAYIEIVNKQQEQLSAVEAKGGWVNATDEERNLKDKLGIEEYKLSFRITQIAFAQYSGSAGKLTDKYYDYKKEFKGRDNKELKAQGVNEWQREINISQQNIELATKFVKTQTKAEIWIWNK